MPASAPLTPPLPTVPAEARAAIPAALAFPGGTAVTGGYSMTPVTSGGVGVRLARDKAGVKIIATLLLKLSAPTVTALSARISTLSAKADYTFGGGLGFTYRPGHFTVDTPGKVTAITDAVDTVEGISVGVNGLVLAYQAKVIIGIGAWGFATGLELGFNASWGITNGSGIAIIECRQATLTMTGTVGIGWAIPHLVAVVVNTILSIFKTKIPESGGVRSASVTIAQRSDYAPQKEICALKPD